MVDDHMLDKVLDEIKEIVGIEKFDDTNILTALDDITLKDVVTWHALLKMMVNFIHKYF